MKLSVRLLSLAMLFFISCGKKQNEVAKAEITPKTPLTAVKPTEEIVTDQQNYASELVVDGIDVPWGMTWLPDGSMLVTERSGILYHVKDGKKIAIKNVPEVFAKNQGGLLDVMLHPNYNDNGWVYITYSIVDKKEKGSHTALIRAKIVDNALTSIEKLYQGSPNVKTAHHFGSRIAFDKEGYVYFTIGDRGRRDENPQDITKDGGKVYRLHDDGRIPEDNPFVGQKDAKTAIYSYGHRNPQGMAVNPRTGQIWVHEHGPRGGDEINPVTKAVNYGWPVITYGINYSGTTITDEKVREGMEQPLYYWVPSIAPSGMAFVTSDRYPALNGHLLVGSLKFQYLELLILTDDEKVANREKLLDGIGRVRSVRQGPDGFIYVGIDGKGIYKMVLNSNKKQTPKETPKTAETTETTETTELTEKVTEKVAVEKPNVSEKFDKEVMAASLKRGKAVYNKVCVQCHLGNGEGVAKTFPPLAKSDWLKDKVTESIRSIKYGLSGEIIVNGKKYNNVMTPLGLSDQEIADVMNYTSNTWGNTSNQLFTAEQISKVKKK
ncbi:PQQ-dependent sugar dehydrogenase [Kordia sp. YSTF-M3]|uniref:PQQ-dependent sugar dehydrogenase n=1 Tax=Kordia aestuariivivens TaxID=2759037 RepID=A0ABR7QCH5_9FLAO|nr:PQQ-dependent sugar dehydrogenase [Kordia aestuariivivens]MBC8756272.1 PQQ-dependent sugar dehydrogenase [Kordia aestuariivivens]